MTYPYSITWRGIPLHIHTDRDGISLIVAIPVDDDEGAIGDDLLPLISSKALDEIESLLQESLREDAA